jgi:hypothetical protein
MAVNRGWVSSNDYADLRAIFDGKDRFMDKPNVTTTQISRSIIPKWLQHESGNLDTDALRNLLKKHFPYACKYNPKCDCYPCSHGQTTNKRYICKGCRECRQASLAIKWYLSVWETYIEGKTAKDIELNRAWPLGTVANALLQMKRIAAGRRSDGKDRTGRPRGRPKVKTEQPEAGPVPPTAERKLLSMILYLRRYYRSKGHNRLLDLKRCVQKT